MRHFGGCLCGNVRYQVEGTPSRVGICHCRYCQLRTGSAFGVSVYFATDRIEVISGKLESYAYKSESGNSVQVERCDNCGTSLFWEIDTKLYSGIKGTAGGTYDPPTFWYEPDREVFCRTKAEFCSIEAPETHLTHPAYAPISSDETRLRGEQEN